ncbi:hypothetical protein KZZ52_30170 [Dactylosporangium sp. AC04546]|uniref:hypothetical protein n=1 Tax=Dactylosporangium sp. AC04546 TaxID=2862460 RepID=UPI001EDD718F|nr:hypothetical protein [Dactylosporangium sp. AC04546]WVK78264.1 hypothetical protein KZZ52_30170 [Dactylosporangium sp. AC04546]
MLDDDNLDDEARRIAARVGASAYEVRPHAYAGREHRIARFDVGGTAFALVPGGAAERRCSGGATPTPRAPNRTRTGRTAA